jgi:hypothetical protein
VLPHAVPILHIVSEPETFTVTAAAVELRITIIVPIAQLFANGIVAAGVAAEVISIKKSFQAIGMLVPLLRLAAILP